MMQKFFRVLMPALFPLVLHAALPENAVIIEAETLKPDNSAWTVKKHFPNWYSGYPSRGFFLAGPSRKQGSAATELKLPEAGTYHLWIRYLDTEKNPGSFVVAVHQQGKVLAERELDKTSLRKTPEGTKKWGEGFARFVWQKVTFQAQRGRAGLTVKKGTVHKSTANGSRHLDVFVLTRDGAYKPDIMDLCPLYVKIRMLPEQPVPAAIHVFGRRSAKPYYTPHMNINAKGLFEGADKGAGNMKKAWLKPGESSPWIKFDPYLSFQGNDRIGFYTLTAYGRRDQKSAAFEVVLSRKPDDSGIFRRFCRKGSGCGMYIVFNQAEERYSYDVEESGKDLKNAQKTVSAGLNPREYPFLTGLNLQPWFHLPSVLEEETSALRLLGINGVTQANPALLKNFPYAYCQASIFHLTKKKCLNCPDQQGLDKMFRNFKGLKQYRRINLMDEPELPVGHVAQCPRCAAGFAEYLKKNQIPLTAEKPVFDKKDPQLFYWSMRYRNHIITKMFRAGSGAVHKYAPGLPTTANFATEVLSGSLIFRGCDWFEIFGSGALTYGWHEDWANHSGTYQVVGYQSGVMRAACRRAGLSFGIYNILCRTPWEIEAKGFAAIGHGNRAMFFFNYGPHYVNASDTNSARPEICQAIRNLTGKTAAVEKILMTGRPARGEAALLLSVTSDIWNDKSDRIFGKERIYLYLLLRHCNYRTDILSEDDLADELKNYRVLFVTDSHLRRSQLKPLLEWVRQGGRLYLTAGALQFDEYNEKLSLGLTRGEYQTISKVGRPERDWSKLKSCGKIDGIPIVGGMQKPLKQVKKIGRGMICSLGFFPGISYQASSKRPDAKKHSVRDYPEEPRKFIEALDLPVKPRLAADHYRIEADLIESPAGSVVVLSNWTGNVRDVTITLDGENHTVPGLGAGGYIVIKERN